MFCIVLTIMLTNSVSSSHYTYMALHQCKLKWMTWFTAGPCRYCGHSCTVLDSDSTKITAATWRFTEGRLYLHRDPRTWYEKSVARPWTNTSFKSPTSAFRLWEINSIHGLWLYNVPCSILLVRSFIEIVPYHQIQQLNSGIEKGSMWSTDVCSDW